MKEAASAFNHPLDFPMCKKSAPSEIRASPQITFNAESLKVETLSDDEFGTPPESEDEMAPPQVEYPMPFDEPSPIMN